jgi:hypothetical protein
MLSRDDVKVILVLGLEDASGDGKPFSKPSMKTYNLAKCRRTVAAYDQIDLIAGELNLKGADQARREHEVAKSQYVNWGLELDAALFLVQRALIEGALRKHTTSAGGGLLLGVLVRGMCLEEDDEAVKYVRCFCALI